MPKKNQTSTGVLGLDRLLDNGLTSGSALAVLGGFGTGKTLLGLSFLLAGARRSEHGLYLSLTEQADTVVFPHRAMDAEFYTLARQRRTFTASLLTMAPSLLETFCRTRHIRRMVVDGLTLINLERLPDVLTCLEAARRLGITVLVTYGLPAHRTRLEGEEEKLGFVCQTVIKLNLQEESAALRRTLVLLKSRNGPHDDVVARCTVSARGLTVDTVPLPAASPAVPSRSRVLCFAPFALLDTKYRAYFQEMFAALKKKRPQFDYELVLAASAKLPDLLRARTSDCALALVFLPDLTTFAEAGQLQPLDRVVPDQTLRSYCGPGLDACRYDGQLYALPWMLDFRTVFCNQDFLHKHRLALPRTWDELIDTARTVVRQERRADLDGINLGALENINSFFLEYLWSLGGDIFDEKGHIAVQNDKGLATLLFLRSLLRQSRHISARLSDMELTARLFTGRTVFLSETVDTYIYGKTRYPRATPAIVPCAMPNQAGPRHLVIQGLGLAVPANTRYPELAAELLNIITSRRLCVDVFRRIGFEWALGVYHDFPRLCRRPDLVALHRQLVRHGFALTRRHSFSRISTLIHNEITAISHKNKSPRTSLNRIYKYLWLYTNRSSHYELVNKVAGFIEANYHRSLSIRELAQRHLISPQHLNHLFRIGKGCSCKNYLLEMRMRQARYLLLNTDYPVNRIAQQVGYTDPYLFSKMFRRKATLSPVTYRFQYKTA
jgi:AraC-like DNA-binding protein/KaiC/GvpD/RAD55 family RecA-like ATPase